jgi:hypothetical protein
MGTLRRAFPIRAIGNNWTLIRRDRSNILRWFWDNRSYDAVRTQYWRVSKGSHGLNLHHWLIPRRWARRWPFIPRGLTNSGLNLVELPAGFNQWLGRGALREVKEFGFRIIFGASLYGSYKGGDYIGSEFMEFIGEDEEQ